MLRYRLLPVFQKKNCLRQGGAFVWQVHQERDRMLGPCSYPLQRRRCPTRSVKELRDSCSRSRQPRWEYFVYVAD